MNCLPPNADELIDVLQNGVCAVYDGHPPAPPRKRGLPYKLKDAGNTELILTKLWKDVVNKRIFVCSTRTINLNEQIEATPHNNSRQEKPRQVDQYGQKDNSGFKKSKPEV